ncbi:TolC family protein [bacterium]|nr:TolC family protein [bacterium]
MDLYRDALAHYPSIRAMEFQEKALRSEKTGLAWQKYLNLDGAVDYFHFSTRDLGRYTSGDIGLFNTIDLFNKKGLERTGLGYEIQKNRSLTRIQKKDIFSQLAEAYYGVLYHSRLLQVHTASLALIERNILLASQGVDKGVFPATEISRWTVEKLNCQNSVRSDSLGLNNAIRALRTLTGLDSVAVDSLDTAGPPAVSETDLLARSPELAVLELERKQALLEVSRESRDHLPDLQVGNSLVRNREPGSTGDQYMVSASLLFKLFDGGRRYRISAARARAEAAAEQERAARAELADFYSSRLQEIETRREMLTNLETATQLSDNTLGKLLEGYRRRFVDFNTVFNAFRDDVALRENYESTRFEYEKLGQLLNHLSAGDIFE